MCSRCGLCMPVAGIETSPSRTFRRCFDHIVCHHCKGMGSCCRKRQSSLPCLDPTAQMQGPTRLVVRTRLRQTGMARSAAGRRRRCPGQPSNRDTLHSAAVSEDLRRTPGPCRRLRFGSARTRPGIRTVRLNTTSLWQLLNEVQLRITMQHRRSRYSHRYRYRRRSSPALQARSLCSTRRRSAQARR